VRVQVGRRAVGRRRRRARSRDYMAGCRRASSAQPGSGSQNEEYEPAAAIVVWIRAGWVHYPDV
jgi:hypothetical protein